MVLDERTVNPDPIVQVSRWLEEAWAAGIPNADAMCLATVAADGRPSARFVLCKGIDARGLRFFTNTESRKANELEGNPRAAAVFYWVALGRQVRAAGTVDEVPRDEADAYFRSRPLGSRIGAWASPQSRPIGSRAELDRLWEDATRRLGEDPPLPPHWGGYRLVPDEMELWEHRDSRLHDRVLYVREAGGAWTRQRLAP
jgi:pyridoxamine 5'-phosphate oxidase